MKTAITLLIVLIVCAGCATPPSAETKGRRFYILMKENQYEAAKRMVETMTPADMQEYWNLRCNYDYKCTFCGGGVDDLRQAHEEFIEFYQGWIDYAQKRQKTRGVELSPAK